MDVVCSAVVEIGHLSAGGNRWSNLSIHRSSLVLDMVLELCLDFYFPISHNEDCEVIEGKTLSDH